MWLIVLTEGKQLEAKSYMCDFTINFGERLKAETTQVN